MTQVVVTFYKFVKLPDFAEKRAPLLATAKHRASRHDFACAEGINGTIAGSRQAIDSYYPFCAPIRV
jgi:UPF0176 protein